MPVPKKRLGRSDQGHRRSNWKATVPAMSSCSHCGAPKLPHTLCGECGYYNGKVVDEKRHAHAHDHDAE